MNTARELTTHLASLLRDERAAMADFLVALADFDQRKLWRELGHASLFSFLRRELGLSAGAAQYRKTAAELIQRHAEVEAALRSGALCLSVVVELAKVVDGDNVAEVLPRFLGLSRREAEALAVSIRPVEHAPRREVVTTLHATAPRLDAALFRPAEMTSINHASAAANGVASAEVVAPAAVPPRDEARPLDARTSRLHFTVSKRFLTKLDAARDALSHSHPNASLEELLEVGLDLVLARHAKRNGLVAKPRNAARPTQVGLARPRSARVPAHVKREVRLRAGGRCEWRFADGERCGSTTRLEYDHVVPLALGGTSTIDNVRIACRGHNLLAARLALGDACMDRYRGGGPPQCG